MTQDPAARQLLADILVDAGRMRPILGLLLGELGVHGTARACEVHQVRRRVSSRTESGAAHWLEVCYAIDVVDAGGAPLPREWLIGRVGGACPDDGTRCARIEGLDLTLWRLPDDPGLPQLRAFLGAGADGATGEIVRYEPGEHCTARFVAPDGSVRYGKLYADAERWQRALRAQRALHAQGEGCADAFRVAAPSVAAGFQAIFTPAQSGLPLAGRLPLPAQQQRLGLALRRLQGCAIDDLPLRLPEDWLALARKWRKKLVRAQAADAGRLDRLIGALEARPPGIDPVTVHGDFHVDQMLLAPDGRLVLFDFDDAAHGAGAQDLADFLSQWRLGRDAAPQLPALVTAWAGAADAAAESAAATDPQLDWYLRLMFLRKAYSFFVHHTPDSRARIDTALQAAEAGSARLSPPGVPWLAAAPLLNAVGGTLGAGL